VGTAFRKVLVGGPSCGHGNLGDELLAELAIRAVHRLNPQAEVRLITHDVRAAKELWHVNAHSWSGHLLRCFAWADCLVAPLATMPFHGPSRVARLLGRARLFRRPTIVIGVGAAAPATCEPRVLRRMVKALNHATVITTRDGPSRDYLSDVGVRRPMIVTADPVVEVKADGAAIDWLWEEVPWPAPRNRPFLAVCMCYVPGYELVPDPPELAAALDWVVEKCGLPVIFVPMEPTPGRDNHYHSQVLTRMRRRNMGHVIFRRLSGPETATIFSCAHMVVGSRLHGLILAACAGTPVIGIARAPKIDAFLARVAEIAVDGSPKPSAQQITAHIADILDRLELKRSEVKAGMFRMREANALNWHLLEAFLHRRLPRRLFFSARNLDTSELRQRMSLEVPCPR